MLATRAPTATVARPTTSGTTVSAAETTVTKYPAISALAKTRTRTFLAFVRTAI